MDVANTLFIMLCALLVLLMTPSLAMFYSGLVQAKNALNTIMNCFIVFGLVSFAWIFFGFSLAYGGDYFGIIGDFSAVFLNDVKGVNANGVPQILYVIYQMMFALIASAIITGSLVGRIKLGVLALFLVFWSIFVYDSLAHMIWDERGFLLMRGGLDFAGGGVVHISAGTAGLIGVLMVGARKEMPSSNEQAHSIPYAFLGGILLFIGWLGFNAGSAGKVDEIAVNAFVVTIIAASSGYIAWICLEILNKQKPSILGSLSGLVAGLVGITPGCGYVSIGSSIIIGASTAIICFWGLIIIKYKLKLDDSLDAFSLHGFGGMWGALCVGLFASKSVNPNIEFEGLFIGYNFHLLIEQILGVLVCFGISAIVSYIIFKIISFFTPLRVDSEHESIGLDASLHGESAYQK